MPELDFPGGDGDSFTEVTRQSWGGKLMASIKGVLTGLILFLGSFVLLFWNEGRAVKDYKSLMEGKGLATTVSADKVEPENEGKLVHITGEAVTHETVADPIFGISQKALKLRRIVKMFQWQEKKESKTKKSVGGSSTTETTDRYEKVWSDKRISSDSFKKRTGHENPIMKYTSQVFPSKNVTVGAFTLSESLLGMINKYESVPVPEQMPETLKAIAQVSENGYYVGRDPVAPEIGDLKVHFEVALPCTVSFAARQIKNTFEPFKSKYGRDILLLQVGTHSKDNLFDDAIAASAMLTWILRFVGFLLMTFGIMMIFNPIVTFADVIPFLGDLLGLGIGLFAVIVSAALSLVTIAIAWLFFRPLLAITLIAIAVGAVFGTKHWLKGRKAPAANQPVA